MPQGQAAVVWSDKKDVELFLTVLAVQKINVDYKAVAAAFGPNVPGSCIQSRMKALRKKASELGFSPPTTPEKQPSKKRAYAPNSNKNAKAHPNNNNDDDEADDDDDDSFHKKFKRAQSKSESPSPSVLLFSSDETSNKAVKRKMANTKSKANARAVSRRKGALDSKDAAEKGRLDGAGGDGEGDEEPTTAATVVIKNEVKSEGEEDD